MLAVVNICAIAFLLECLSNVVYFYPPFTNEHTEVLLLYSEITLLIDLGFWAPKVYKLG
jgi:hypothetical protein